MKIKNYFLLFCLLIVIHFGYSQTCPASVIVAQPSSSTVCEGDTTVFIISAHDTLGLQWQVDSGSGFNDLNNSSLYGGVTNDTLTVYGALAGLDGFLFRCIVTDDTCTIESDTVELIVNLRPSISATTSAARCDSGSVVLSATASAGVINWYAAAAGDTILATGTSYTVASLTSDTTLYVDATENGCTTLSRTAVVGSLLAVPTASITTADAKVCAGEIVNIDVTLTGTAPWSVIYAIDSVNQTTLTATASPFTFTTNVRGEFTLSVVTDSNNCSATVSGSTTITENTPIVVLNKTVTCDSNDSTYVVEFDLSGGELLGYDVTGDTGSFITNTHFVSDSIPSDSSYTFNITDIYNCSPFTISGTKSCSVTCNAAASIIGDTTLCSGGVATISIVLTGVAPWEVVYAIDNVNQSAININTSPYTFTTTTNAVYTVASVFDANSCSGTGSGSAEVKFNTAISISNKVVTCNNGDTTYIVEFDIAGGDSASYTVNGGTIVAKHFVSDSIHSDSTYTFIVTDVYHCDSVTVTGTKSCNVFVCNATAIISGDTTLCANGVATINVDLTGKTPWQVTYAINGVSQTAKTAASSPFTFTTTTSGKYTLVSVTDSNNCSAVVSDSAVVTVISALTVTKTETCLAGDSTYIVQLTISGGDSTTYYVTGDTGTFTSTAIFVSDTIAADSAYSFTVNDSSGCNPVVITGTKSCATATVVCNATATISGDTTICANGKASIKFNLTGTAPWQVIYAINGVSQTSVVVAVSPYTFTTSVTGNYALVSVTDSNSCSAVISADTAVVALATPITISNDTAKCNNTYTDYVIEFDIAGGSGANYTVLGGLGSIVGNHFTSTNIPSGTSYTFTVNDSYNCNPIVVTGTETCSNPACTNTAFIISSDSICGTGSATVVFGFTGKAPWSITYAKDGVTQAAIVGHPTATYTLTTGSLGVYKLVSVMDGNNCTATITGKDSAVVAQGAAPKIGSTVTPYATICKGQSISIFGTGASNYSWTGGISNGVAFTPTVTTTYTVTGSSTKGCVGIATRKITVNEIPKVGVVVDPSSATICKGQAVKLTGTGATAYDWSGGITNNIYFVPDKTTTYTVTGTALTTCTAKATKTITVVTCVGVDEFAAIETLSVYPIPTEGKLTVSILNARFTTLNITVINMLGATVYSTVEKGNGTEFNKQLDLTNLNAGVYYLKLNAEGIEEVKKIVIQ